VLDVIRWIGACVVALALAACSRTYHPDYHPETRYSFIQNISVGSNEGRPHCRAGHAAECFHDCMTLGSGEACYLLGVMFEIGDGVRKDHETASRLVALADKLGYAGAAIDLQMAAPYLDLWGGGERAPAATVTPSSSSGVVTSGTPVVVYGSMNGDIYLTR
jgi:hypothetical protein